MVCAPADDRERAVLDRFTGLGITSKFNDHGIGVPALTVGAGEEAVRDAAVLKGVEQHTPTIVGKWFNRDAEGAMDIDLIMERGRYSQDDMDRMIQILSTVDRSGAQGWQLLDLSYVVVYDVTKVEYKRTTTTVPAQQKKTGTQRSGNLLDAINKAANTPTSNTSNTSSKTTKETDVYRVEYTADLYKLQWTDSLEWQFVNRYWNPRTAPDAAKAAAWGDATFPMMKVASFKDYFTERREVRANQGPPEEMLAAFAPQMQKSAVARFSKKVAELRPRAPVVEAYPLTAALGSKEDLRVNDRFMAFEYKQGRKGYSMQRKGVVRAYKVSRNSTESDGRSARSVFQQQGGWRIWPGMGLEERHDLGMNISGGYTLGDAFSTGASVSFKSNILGTALKFPNFYIGANLSVLSGNSINASGIVMPRTLELASASTNTLKVGEWKGSGTDISLMLSKEFYLLNRGNLYLEPTLAYSWVSWRFSGNGSTTFSDKTFGSSSGVYDKWDDNGKNGLSYKTGMFWMGCGIGHHFGPFLALEVRPMAGLRGAYKYDGDSAWRTLQDPNENVTLDNAPLSDDAETTRKMFQTSFVPSAMLAVKVRF